MLDFDLAAFYEVETKVFNQAVKRNIESFPEDFMFQLTNKEWNNLSSQFVTSRLQEADNKSTYRSQIVILKQKKTRWQKIYSLCFHRTWRYNACQCFEKSDSEKNEYCNCKSIYSIKKNCKTKS